MKSLQGFRLLVAMAAVAATPPAAAAILSYPGVTPFDAVAGAHPGDRGAVLDETSMSFSYTAACCGGHVWRTGGAIEHMVVRTADGTLDFHWRYSVGYEMLESPYGGGASTSFLVLQGFHDPRFTYDAKVLSGSGIHVPGHARLDDPDFPWTTPPQHAGRGAVFVPPSDGAWSAWFFFDTDAVHYDMKGEMGSHTLSLNQGGSHYAPSFRPIAAIPEPSTWASLGLGLGLLGAVAARRRPRPATSAAPASPRG